MTESLKSVLTEQAASVAFKPPDLDAIARDNGRRVRRRRAVTALAAVAVVAVAGAAVVLSGPASRRPDAPAAPWPVTVSWALGSTIHNGDDTIEVGHEVRAFVRTSVGFVTLDSAGNVYSVTSRGVTQVGRALIVAVDGAEQRGLVSDPHGSLVGWIGVDQAGVLPRVHDQATGQTRSYGTAGTAGPGLTTFFAIDGRTAYVRVAAGVFAVDLDTGAERPLASGEPAGNFEIWSVEQGVLAFSRYHQIGNVTWLAVGRSVDDVREYGFPENTEADDGVRLSPTGAWLSYLLYEFDGSPIYDKVRAVRAQVRDAGTGEQVTLDLPPGTFGVPAVWLDDTTVQLLVIGPAPGQGNMYTCVVPSGSCDVAAELPADALEDSALVLPTGQFIRQ
jgi:hypothetical protein